MNEYGAEQLSSLSTDDRALLDIADALRGVAFDLTDPTVVDATRRTRDRLARLVEGVVTRTALDDAPLLVVIGGGSGAGKSTVCNTLTGRRITAVGVVRPTTRIPTLVCHPDDRAWFADRRVLPDLARRDATTDSDLPADEDLLDLAVSDQLPAGVAILDTPDIDSVEHANHRLAEQALDDADAWLWLVTARSYADEVGMRHLRRAQRRHALTMLTVTQLRDGDRDEVLADVDRLLRHEGVALAGRPVIGHLEVRDGQLPSDAVAPLLTWLTSLAPAAQRRAVRSRALAGLRASLPTELAALVTALDLEVAAAHRLHGSVAARAMQVGPRLDAALDAGLPLRADILDRWRRAAGDTELFTRVQSTTAQLAGLVRTRLGLPARERSEQVAVEVTDQLTQTLAGLLTDLRRQLRSDLETDHVGRRLLDDRPSLREDDPTARAGAVRAAVADWHEQVSALVADIGGSRLTAARRVSTAMNATAASAMLVLFSLSGGLTGGELGIAAGATATSQYLLTKLLGDRQVRRLLADARADLHGRLDALVTAECRPIEAAISDASPDLDAVDLVRSAAAAR